MIIKSSETETKLKKSFISSKKVWAPDKNKTNTGNLIELLYKNEITMWALRWLMPILEIDNANDRNLHVITPISSEFFKPGPIV